MTRASNHPAATNPAMTSRHHAEDQWRRFGDLKRHALPKRRIRRMELNPKDIRINRYYLGPEKGSSVEAVYLPTGVSVAELIPPGSTETGHTLHARLLAALKLKIEDGGKSGKA